MSGWKRWIKSVRERIEGKPLTTSIIPVRRRAQLRVEQLEAREVPALNPSGFEQEMLELLNRMRLDPAGELNRILTSVNPPRSADPFVDATLQFYQVNGAVLAQQWSSLRAAPAIAWNEKLMNAALAHTQLMITHDEQSHQLPGEPAFWQRITNAGYTTWNTVAENIFAYAESPYHAHAAFAIDWGFGPNGIQSPPGHRENMMAPDIREVGITVVAENNESTGVGPFVMTQDFGRRTDQGNPYLLGVVFTDSNSSGWYNMGEGAGGVNVLVSGTGGTFSTTTMSAGGYQLQVPAGTYTVTFSGGGLPGIISKQVQVTNVNFKLDAKTSEAGGGGGTGANNAPLLNAAYNAVFTNIIEDNSNSAGDTVASLVGSAITDFDPGAQKGVAVVGSSNTSNGTWQYSLDSGNTWLNLGTVSNSAARLLRDSDRLRFVPNADFNGSVNVTVRAWDQTTESFGQVVDLTSPSAVGGSTAYSTATDTVALTVIPVNDAPRVNTAASFTFASVKEDSVTSTGSTVGSMLGSNVNDPDAGAQRGIAVTGFGGTSGTWQFSLNNGVNWQNFGSQSEASARLLRDTDLVRLLPTLNASGPANLSFRAWDRTSGTAGGLANVSSNGNATSYSLELAAAVLNVTPVNDAPTLISTPAFNLPPLAKGSTNPAGTPVSAMLAGSLSDIDANALRGAAFYGSTGTGTWQYSRNGGATWTNFGTLSASAARLLADSDLIRFVPSVTFGGTASLSFRGWDQSTGSAGTTANLSLTTSVGGTTAFSTGIKTVSVFVNGAPVVMNNSGVLPTILEDATTSTGALVSTFIATSLSDTDTGAIKSIAVSGTGGIAGTWQYSSNGTTWISLGAVSEASAKLIKSTDRLRFLPAANANGVATLLYHGWDQTTGTAYSAVDLTQPGSTGGATAYSSGVATGKITVTAVNDAPVLSSTTFTQPDFVKGSINSGVTVAALLGSSYSDVDFDAKQGIVIYGLTATTGGSWQYSINGGTSWVNFGAVSTSAARLLRSQDLLRFVPNASFTGLVSFSFRGWDQTTGTGGGVLSLVGRTFGGTSPFSLQQATGRWNVVNV